MLSAVQALEPTHRHSVTAVPCCEKSAKFTAVILPLPFLTGEGPSGEADPLWRLSARCFAEEAGAAPASCAAFLPASSLPDVSLASGIAVPVIGWLWRGSAVG